jgi:hypothetical protein
MRESISPPRCLVKCTARVTKTLSTLSDCPVHRRLCQCEDGIYILGDQSGRPLRHYKRSHKTSLEALFVVEISGYDELMIPQEKSAAVWRGLEEAFGTRSIEDIRRMTRAHSSDLMLRIVVRGSPYLLRITTRMDERNDPARVFTCMKAAAEAGLASCPVFQRRRRDRDH